MASSQIRCSEPSKSVTLAPALGSEQRFARRDKFRPRWPVDAIFLPAADVVLQCVGGRMPQEPFGDPFLFLGQFAEPVRQGAAAIADLDRPIRTRRRRHADDILRHIASERRVEMDAGQRGRHT